MLFYALLLIKKRFALHRNLHLFFKNMDNNRLAFCTGRIVNGKVPIKTVASSLKCKHIFRLIKIIHN